MYNISHTIANNSSSDNGNGNDWFIGSTKQVLRDAHTQKNQEKKIDFCWTKPMNVRIERRLCDGEWERDDGIATQNATSQK